MFERHEDHLIGTARTLKEFPHIEARFGHFHRREGLRRLTVVFDMVGDVVIRAAFDHFEIPAHTGAFRHGPNLWLLEPVARAEHAAQAEDQEDRNAGQHQERQQGGIHVLGPREERRGFERRL
jgi:hypothetical protein